MGYRISEIKQQSKIDLPEEITIVSSDEKHPDTLLGYTLNNRLYIRFKH